MKSMDWARKSCQRKAGAGSAPTCVEDPQKQENLAMALELERLRSEKLQLQARQEASQQQRPSSPPPPPQSHSQPRTPRARRWTARRPSVEPNAGLPEREAYRLTPRSSDGLSANGFGWYSSSGDNLPASQQAPRGPVVPDLCFLASPRQHPRYAELREPSPVTLAAQLANPPSILTPEQSRFGLDEEGVTAETTPPLDHRR